MWEEIAIFSQLDVQLGKKSRFFIVGCRDWIKMFDESLYFSLRFNAVKLLVLRVSFFVWIF